MHKIKYIVYPSVVLSKTDKQVHYISADSLMHLYRVKREDCVIANEHNYYSLKERYKNAVVLFPDYNGNYKIKQEKINEN